MRRWLIQGAAILALAVVLSCARNQPPEIIAVKAFPEEVSTGDSCDLLVSATDPENGKLKIKWSSKDGKFESATDSATKWKAPSKPGTYKLSVTVTDPRKGVATKSVEVKVSKGMAIYSGSLFPSEESPRRRSAKSKSSRKPKAATAGEGEETPAPAKGKKAKTPGETK